MKVAGLEYRLWRHSAFPAGFRIEHATVEAERNGDILLADDELVDAGRLGVLVWDGDPDLDPTGGRGLTVSKALREARRQSHDAVLLVSAPRAALEDIARFVAERDGRILNRRSPRPPPSRPGRNGSISDPDWMRRTR